MDDLVKARSEANASILNMIKTYLEVYPELRFIQALWALHIIDSEDRFGEEPSETLHRMFMHIK